MRYQKISLWNPFSNICAARGCAHQSHVKEMLFHVMRKPAPSKCVLDSPLNLRMGWVTKCPGPITAKQPQTITILLLCLTGDMSWCVFTRCNWTKNCTFSHRFTQSKCKSPRCHQDVVFFPNCGKSDSKIDFYAISIERHLISFF